MKCEFPECERGADEKVELRNMITGDIFTIQICFFHKDWLQGKK